MKDGRLSARGKLIQAGIWLGLVCGIASVINTSLLGIQSELFSTSGEDYPPDMGHSTFYLKVAANGESVYEGAEAISQTLRAEIMGRVYPSPDAAIDAALGELPGNPAGAHAVLLCTTRDGVISRNTGGSWHSTNHRYDSNGIRYTKTAHYLNAHPAPYITDVFYGHVDKRYC